VTSKTSLATVEYGSPRPASQTGHAFVTPVIRIDSVEAAPERLPAFRRSSSLRIQIRPPLRLRNGWGDNRYVLKRGHFHLGSTARIFPLLRRERNSLTRFRRRLLWRSRRSGRRPTGQIFVQKDRIRRMLSAEWGGPLPGRSGPPADAGDDPGFDLSPFRFNHDPLVSTPSCEGRGRSFDPWGRCPRLRRARPCPSE